jgi:glycosyltransferase involved in cell wall biosynthesis
MYCASVVVPWWDHIELLRLWTNNLHHLSDAEVIFIDNGSASQGKQELEEFCDRHAIRLIRNEENRGYAAANNQGAAIATGEYILFLNNDVEILKPPVQYLCQLAGDGIAGPGPLQTITHELCVEGWALCIKKSTLQAIGGWCEDYGAGYWDDVDLCYRAKYAGYRLICSGEFFSHNWTSPTTDAQRQNAWIHHLGGITGDDGRLQKTILDRQNQARFTQKFYPELKDINTIVFPDWSQPEEIISRELEQAVWTVLSHPNQAHISLLIDGGDLSQEDACLIASSVVMNVLLENTLEITEEPTIAVLEKLHQLEWEPIHCRLHARLRLPHENISVVDDRARTLPIYSLDEFSQTQIIQEETGLWRLQ